MFKIVYVMKQKKEFKELTEDQLKAVTGGKLARINKDADGCYVEDNGIRHCPSDD